MDQNTFPARRWVMNEPGFLELKPGFRIELIQFILHGPGVRLGMGVRVGVGAGVGDT